MPAVQTSYTQTLTPALEGALATLEPMSITSHIVETSAGIGFGKVAIQGTADSGILVSAANGKFVGITVQDRTVSAANPNAYAQRDTAAVLREGAIWVLAGEAVAAGDPAYFVPASGAIVKTATDNILIPGGRFETSAASGALAVLRIS